MTPNRIVAFLTPLVFAPLAGVISAWAAENLPGVQVSQDALQEIFIAGALIALAPALQWLHGWQKHEARTADALATAATTLTPPAGEWGGPAESAYEELDELDDFDELEELEELEDFGEYEDIPVGDEQPATVRS